MMKRWGEYVAVVGTGIFIPLEVYEILERVTWLRVARWCSTCSRSSTSSGPSGCSASAAGEAAFEAEREGVSLLEVEQAALSDGRRTRGGLRRAGRARAAEAAASAPSVKRIASRPAAAAAATLAAESSTNTQLLQRPADPRPGAPRRSAGSGLAHALGAGDHDVVEEAEEVEALQRVREQLVGPVGQREQRDAGRVQVAQHLDVAVDRAERG